MRNSQNSRRLVLLGLLGCFVGWYMAVLYRGCVSSASAQVDASAVMASTRTEESERPRIPPMDPRFRSAPIHVALARAAWKEAGQSVTDGEVAAMYAVIVNRHPNPAAFRHVLWAYSKAIRNPRHAAVHNLNENTNYPGWARVVDAARRAVTGELTHECAGGLLVHWGGPNVDASEIQELVDDGYAVATCPGYNNTFLYEVQ